MSEKFCCDIGPGEFLLKVIGKCPFCGTEWEDD